MPTNQALQDSEPKNFCGLPPFHHLGTVQPKCHFPTTPHSLEERQQYLGHRIRDVVGGFVAAEFPPPIFLIQKVSDACSHGSERLFHKVWGLFAPDRLVHRGIEYASVEGDHIPRLADLCLDYFNYVFNPTIPSRLPPRETDWLKEGIERQNQMLLVHNPGGS